MHSSKFAIPAYPSRAARLEPIEITPEQSEVIAKAESLAKRSSIPGFFGIGMSVVAVAVSLLFSALAEILGAKNPALRTVLSWWCLGTLLVAVTPWVIAYGRFCNAFGLPTIRSALDGSRCPQQHRRDICVELINAQHQVQQFNAGLAPEGVPTLPTRRAADERYRADHRFYHAVIRAERLIKQYY